MNKQFSLRGHKAPIACVCRTQHGPASADRNGWVIVWDLGTRRPRGFWKAHDEQIITMVETDLGLMTQGKDSAVRFWKLDLLSVESDLAYMGKEGLPKPKSEEVPVNTLNFCNVDYCSGMLATASTTDSENFDIYELLKPGEPFALRRIVQGYAVGTKSHDETKRDGEGIIMKLRFVSSSLLFAGYESGTVKGFSLEDVSTTKASATELLVLNKDFKVREVFSYSGHSPQPVLSLEYDATKQNLYTGSASKKLIVVSIGDLLLNKSSQKRSTDPNPTPQEPPQKSGGLSLLLGRPKIELIEEDSEPVECPILTHNLRHAGILNIQIGVCIHIVFWDGVVKSYTKSLEEVGRNERQVARIQLKAPDAEVSSPTTKALCVSLIGPETNHKQATSKKELIKLRKLRKDSLMYIGYGDGLLSAYTLESES